MTKCVLIGWERCSTCKKARKFLDSNHIDYEFRDIMESNPTVSELTSWIENSGYPIKRFFNTSGFVYRDMGLKNKLDSMSSQEQIELLASTGRLVRRPILIGDHGIFVGFHLELYETLIS